MTKPTPHPSRVTPTSQFHVTGVQPKQSHTPGPWLARQFVSGHWEIVEDNTSNRLAGVQSDGRNGDDGANARLIAAAPDLLALVREAVRFYDSVRPGGRVLKSDPDIEAARALLARIAGGAP